MKEVQQWTLVICLAALATSLAQSLLPAGTMEHMGKFVVGAFMICVIIAPISKIVPQVKVNMADSPYSGKTQSSMLESTVSRQMEEEAQKSISNLVASQLGKINIKCKNVQTVMDTNSDGRISISKVVVRLESKSTADRKAAQEYLQKQLGLKTEVISDAG